MTIQVVHGTFFNSKQLDFWNDKWILIYAQKCLKKWPIKTGCTINTILSKLGKTSYSKFDTKF